MIFYGNNVLSSGFCLNHQFFLINRWLHLLKHNTKIHNGAVRLLNVSERTTSSAENVPAGNHITTRRYCGGLKKSPVGSDEKIFHSFLSLSPSVLQDKSLYHPVSNSCIDCSPNERRIFMNTCDPSSLSQQWLFERTNSTVLDHFNQGAN